MQSDIHARFRNSRDATTAQAILRACVHCGFCNATCPTYLDLGDERDGPRGRIYLIRQLLESGEASERTQRHLDRCLTCRNCETTCPSGVQYGRLLDIGKGILETDLRRPWRESLKRKLLGAIVPFPARFAFVLALARAFRFALPRSLQNKIPHKQTRYESPDSTSTGITGQSKRRRMLLLDGCAQAAATPQTNAAARRVCERLGIELIVAPGAGCCGALNYHLGEHERGRAFMRANIDAWWPFIEAGTEAIVMTASGCGSTVREYGELLADDAQYARKAARVSALTRDIAEIIEAEDTAALLPAKSANRFALQCPCSLQHGQKLGARLENLLKGLGFELVGSQDSHLCCGSAGSYSLLQPQISERLRDRKLEALTSASPDAILTANVGCQLHLGSAADIPVRHWIEALDAACSQKQVSK